MQVYDKEDNAWARIRPTTRKVWYDDRAGLDFRLSRTDESWDHIKVVVGGMEQEVYHGDYEMIVKAPEPEPEKPKIALWIDYRFPEELPKRRQRWDIYDCYWKDNYKQIVELPELTVDAVIQAMHAIEKPDNGCDSMRIKARMKIGEVELKFERDVDLNLHTALFPDGRSVQYRTTWEDGVHKTSNHRFQEALIAAGYIDLIPPNHLVIDVGGRKS